MSYKRICISSGHGKYVRGAAGIIDGSIKVQSYLG